MDKAIVDPTNTLPNINIMDSTMTLRFGTTEWNDLNDAEQVIVQILAGN
jgi:hypothetical protein